MKLPTIRERQFAKVPRTPQVATPVHTCIAYMVTQGWELIGTRMNRAEKNNPSMLERRRKAAQLANDASMMGPKDRQKMLYDAADALLKSPRRGTKAGTTYSFREVQNVNGRRRPTGRTLQFTIDELRGVYNRPVMA